MGTVQEVLDVAKELRARINTFEGKLTEAMKDERISAETQAKIDEALAVLKEGVADADDGVDEAAVPADPPADPPVA